jgi:hypothetical protein
VLQGDRPRCTRKSRPRTRICKVYEPWKKFRDDQVSWFSIAEGRFDNFMVGAARTTQQADKKKS